VGLLEKILVFSVGVGVGYIIAGSLQSILGRRAEETRSQPISYLVSAVKPMKEVLQIQQEEVLKTRPPAAKQINSKRITLSPGEEKQYKTLPMTDYVVITIFDAPVQVSFGSPVTVDTQLYPVGSTVVHPVPPTIIYMKNPSTTDTAKVYISEWRYET